MFWRFGGYTSISSLHTLLEKPNVTVEELLDDADLIQELKQQNAKLLEILREEYVLERLLQYVIAPKNSEDDQQQLQPSPEPEDEDTSGGGPLNSFFSRRRRSRSKSLTKSDPGEDESKEEKQRLKYAFVACEVLSSEVWSIADALLENRETLRKFWEYLKQEPPLDPLQAGYFTKVNESLLDKKTEEMLDIFKSIDNVVEDMLKHVDCPVIMDLLLKIISLERNEGGQGIVDWLQSQGLIPLLLSLLAPDRCAATQTSAGDFLKAIITISANATAPDTNVIGPNELTRELVSEECVKQLISDMLQGGNPLTVGVGIIIEVIRKNNSDYDIENQTGPTPKSTDPIYLGTLLRQFANHVPDFMHLMLTSRKKELSVAFGSKIEPLGFDRFKTCELMAELLHCSNMQLLNERGSENEVKRRDVERSRLKAEGKLGPSRENPVNEFGTSVDSSGFHFASAPSISADSPEEIKRQDLPTNSEEEFENVTASEVLGDDIKDDLDEPDAIVGVPLERSPKVKPRELEKSDDDLIEPPLSPRKRTAPQAPDEVSSSKLEGDLATNANSPTSTGLTARLGSVDLDTDTIMQESESETSSAVVGDIETSPPSNSGDLSPRADDRPAPLFAGKRSLSPEKPSSALPTSDVDDGKAPVEEVTTPYEIDIDGRPVVGDLLKMMFVKHRVVPTILDFFFRFPWNNFLHNVVYDVVQQVFNAALSRGFNRSLAIDLFQTGRITERIVEGQEASDKAQAESNMRLGYMGHITLIAEEVVKFTERHAPEQLSQAVVDKVVSPTWVHYVEHTLAETRERDNAILGGVRPDVNGGTRAAVLNAVNAAHSFGGASPLVNLTSTVSLGLDSADLANTGGSTPGNYPFSGNSLLSGFSQGSSDEEDEEMDDGELPRQTLPVDDSEQVGELSFEDIDMGYP
ncbi:SAPS-domain-containing protein [Trichodelitschia bisporula]|uniref:SAPS-domain-containing protein n=1 Tax=Trichodelitschia bisporula TaxID=703511 RepID=A0A6G1HXY1_9PEZI|nr:SAPS-domain-containing protein [Trichodelitschia bisporula]